MHVHHRLAEAIAGFLVREQRADGALWDWVEKKPCPVAHGHAFFALACYLLYARTHATRWRAAFEDALAYVFSALPGKTRDTLASLALLLLYARLRKDRLLPATARALQARIPSMALEGGPGSPLPNHCASFRLAAEALRAAAGQAPASALVPALCDHVLAAQLPDGVFCAYPPGPARKGAATPLAYHAAACAGLAMYLQLSADKKAQASLFSGLGVLEQALAPDGQALWHGCSANASVAYAWAIYALLVASRLKALAGSRLAARYTGLARHFLDWLEERQWAGGAVHAFPRASEHGAALDRDRHVSADNAFCAALLLLAPGFYATPAPPRARARLKLPHAGLYAVRGRENGFFFALSLLGQSAPGWRTRFDDTRYYAGQPLVLQWEGRDVLPPPPTYPDPALALDPAACGGLPFVRANGRVFALHTASARLRCTPGRDTLAWKGVPVHAFTLGFPFQQARLFLSHLLTRRLVTHNTHPLQGASLEGKALVFPSKRLVLFYTALSRAEGKAVGCAFFTGRLFGRPQRGVDGVVSSPLDGLVYEKLYPRYQGAFSVRAIPTHKGEAFAFFEEDLLEGKSVAGLHALYPKGARPRLRVTSSDGLPAVEVDGKKIQL